MKIWIVEFFESGKSVKKTCPTLNKPTKESIARYSIIHDLNSCYNVIHELEARNNIND